MGVLGISYDDFCLITPEQFNECCKAWHEVEDSRQRQEWERMRLLATITVQPHTKKRLKPKALIPLPWDTERQKEEPQLNEEQRLMRLKKLLKNGEN